LTIKDVGLQGWSNEDRVWRSGKNLQIYQKSKQLLKIMYHFKTLASKYHRIQTLQNLVGLDVFVKYSLLVNVLSFFW